MGDRAVFEAALADLFLGSCEWLGCLVIGGDERIDVLLQLLEWKVGVTSQVLDDWAFVIGRELSRPL